MASREAFLSTVRAALGRSEGGGHDTGRARETPEVNRQEAHARAERLRERLAKSRDVLLAKLQETAPLQEWNLVTVSSDMEAREAITRIAEERGARMVVRTAHPAVERLKLDDAFADKRIASTLLSSSSAGMDQQGLQEVAAGADIGVTGVDYLIADTASACLVSRKGASRMASLLPPVHIAVVQLDQLVGSLADLLALREADLAQEGSPNWYMNLVSGPSRTADIEQTIVVGVHGPGEVYLVVIGV